MNITPINLTSFSGKYYNFEQKDPRKEHHNFELGMADNDVVDTLAEGDNHYYYIYARDVRTEQIKKIYPRYESYLKDSEIVGKRFDDGFEYGVTAGQVRAEILDEERHQLLVEKRQKAQEIKIKDAHISKPWWEIYPY